tara:strand:- start:40092 stop:40532 length:441 start_codon:yes stop_codon:yes gene_type:complete
MMRAIWSVCVGLLLFAALVAAWPISVKAPVRAHQSVALAVNTDMDRIAARFSSPPMFDRSVLAVAAAPIAAATAAPTSAVPVLAGIAEDELGMMVWLGTDRVGVRPLRVDDEIDGWAVRRITATEVELGQDARIEVLRFFAANGPG